MVKRKRKAAADSMGGRKVRAGGRSCVDLAGNLIGSVQGGPRDASTNKRYLDEAILADCLKRTIKDYRKTLRRLAAGPRRSKRG